jgi:hypothetical protein
LVPLGNQFIVYIVIWIGSLFLSGRQYSTLWNNIILHRTCGPKIVGNEPQRHQTKDYKIGICCFSAKHTTLRRKSKD